jgi:hypothetical protein
LAGCISNGTNTPIIGPTNGLYFQASPGPQTGIMLVDVLVPDNVPTAGLHISVAIISGGSGARDALLVNGGIDGPRARSVPSCWLLVMAPSSRRILSRPIRFDAFLPSTLALDPGATGFHVYESMVLSDPQTLAQEGSPPVPG